MIDYAHQQDKWEWAPFFTVQEFTCKGNGACLMDADFMQRLFQLREEFNRPMVVTSGYRSPDYNLKVAETGATGPHTTGCAVDIAVNGSAAYDLINLAMQHGFTGIGISQKGLSHFVHLDTLQPPLFPRKMIWTY